MGKLSLPRTAYGWIGTFSGLIACFLYITQMLFGWFTETNADRAIYSLIVLVFICTAIGFITVANRYSNTRRFPLKDYQNPLILAIRYSMMSFIIVILLMMILNGVSMSLDTQYNTYANNDLGFFTGLRQLTSVTAEDVNSLKEFANGVAQLSRAMFLIVPCLIGTWGGLSVLTADSIDEAEGGILAILAAMVVFFVVWIFKAINVSLMTLSILPQIQMVIKTTIAGLRLKGALMLTYSRYSCITA